MPLPWEKSATGSSPKPPEDLHHAWRLVYEFQRARILDTYSDHGDKDDLQDFFFDLAYMHPDRRASFEKRDRAFVSIARNWLLRRLTSHELIEYLETAIALRWYTDRFDLAAAQYLLDNDLMPPHGEILTRENHRLAVTATTTLEQRRDQRLAVRKTLELCNRIINELPFNLRDILRYTPRFFMRNADLLHMCVQAYHVFDKYGKQLDDFDAIIHERETAYLESLFSNSEDS